MKRIIFYHPQPLVDHPEKGSELRPVRMLQAFRDCGFEVDVVTGDSKQRRKRMRAIRRAVRRGRKYEFLYAESTNMPIPLTDVHHMPVRPIQDFSFLRFLSKRGVPIGLYYRDVYWQVDDLTYDWSWLTKVVKQTGLRIDWEVFRKYVDHLFLPTAELRSLLPTHWPAERLSALPPGCDKVDLQTSSPTDQTGPLRLFYVGGVKPPYYDLRPLLEIVKQLEGICLTLCCRRSEWTEHRMYYEELSSQDRVKIVHASSNEIGRFYRAAEVVADLRRPEGYLRTALPIKTVEAIGYGVPMLLRSGTTAAEFVEEEGTGWTVETLDDAKTLFARLRDQRQLVWEKREDVKEAQPDHSWQARARQAAAVLRSESDVIENVKTGAGLDRGKSSSSTPVLSE
jgi:glycosyltransferase involved in cell wall biosynthesis